MAETPPKQRPRSGTLWAFFTLLLLLFAGVYERDSPPAGYISNCDATAECGEFAKTPGQAYPLNVCYSEYGFCSTTDEFCNDDCQSNCDLHPDPPAGSASAGVLENKVIGYYESWSARKDCHKVSPMDLLLDALTQYVFPSSKSKATPRTDTLLVLFEDTTSVKAVKEQIKIFVSIGGWTFSDNDTSTQPLFGEIAADPIKRTTFANNVVHFMKQYGFDGVDLDWEYPGAPDRGGNPEDTENYVLLLKTLREVFDASGGDYGITFTAPSSYWYLRWFDLPSMVKHVDWINLMTYNLHGVWDSTNPIGSIVQAHTNLTEIKLANELFWRVGIPPAKLVMGFGFYGRSFTLANPDCTKPGCPFSGASSPGPCSATGGILTYYEIIAALKDGSASKSKRAAITPVHDKDDAVKYFIFDDDQWISYDDETTFKQKASDQDTDKYDGHAALIQRDIITNPTLQNIEKALSNPSAVIDNIGAFNGQKCFQYNGDCIDLDDNSAMADAYGAGFTVVGTAESPYAVPPAAPPRTTSGAATTTEAVPARTAVPSAEREAGSGGGDCANANYGETEVEVDRSTYRDKGTGYDWGRQQAICCTVTKAPIKSATCSVDLCTKTLGYCPATENDGGSSSSATSKRDLTLLSTHGHTAAHTSLQPRAGSKTYYIKNFRLISMAYPSSLALLAFPPILQVLREWFRIDQGPYLGRNIEYGYFSTHGGSPNITGLEVEHPIDRQVLVSFFNTVNTQLLPSGQFSRFTAIDGDTLRSVLHAENEALAARPPVQVNPDGVPVGVQPDSANDRLFEALGLNDYPYPFSLLEKQVNAAKGRLMGGKAATAVETVRTDAKKALESGEDIDINKMLQDVRIGISIFDYLNEAEAGYVEQDVPQLPDLAARWEEFFNDFMQTRQEEA
ncbi:uncharacterized protein N7482_010046 [Penicillium canariense]|uniref:chitinase n=1 Tax=Penicillium canariense TaxID=189055 RepID=A0A9W9HR81_9EURO|nr:uncharacterized protein N7482_010046 [Penicillium canariense]KAJ5153568.1 hypothetical protein N7482_010046 [Penicillium canariense]